MAEETNTPENINSDLLNQGTTNLNDFLPFNGEKLNMSDNVFNYKPIMPDLVVNQLPIRERVTGYPNDLSNPAMKATAQDFSNYLGNSLEKFQNNKSYIRPHAYDASSQGAHKARYKAYGQATYDRIGFNPEINNELMYNAKTTHLDDTLRMLQHSALPLLFKGAISGPKSYWQMAHGNFDADPDEALDYEDATSLGYSTKGGLLGFSNNLLNSFSYTLGILGEGMIEGAIVGGAIGTLAGPEGTAVGAAGGLLEGGIASLLKLPKGLMSIAKIGGKLMSKLDDLKDVSKAKSFFTAAASKTGKFINPLDNITDFAKLSRTDEFANLSNLAKTSKGFGAFYFDLRNINMALAEGRLEGGMMENQTYREMYDKYYNKHGEAPSDDLQKEYRKVANQVGLSTTLKNAVLINYTNKLTVPNIMQGSARRLLSTPEKILELKGFNVMLNPKAGFEVTEATFKNSLKALRHPGTYGKMGLGYFKRNLFEGLQEVGQEIIGESTKNYYMDSYYDPAKATFDYSIGTIGSAARKQFSAQGWETFASGFAMGFLQGGLDSVSGAISKKASVGYNKHFNKDKYVEYQTDLAETKQRAQDVVDELNTLYKDPVEFFNSKYFNYGTQSRVARIHDDEDADTKEVKDAKDAAFISGVYSMLETGTSKYFIDSLKDFKKLDPKQLEETLKLKEGEGVKAIEKIDKTIEKINRMEKTHAFWTEKMKSPVKLSNYKKDTPEYEMAALYHKAWQRGQFNAIFMDESFKENLTRLNGINSALSSLAGTKDVNINDIQIVTDPERFITEIDLLTEEIAVLKTLNDDKSKKQVTQKTNKLEAMQNMMEDYVNYDSHYVSKSTIKERIKAIKEKEGLSDKDAEIKALEEVEKDLTDSETDHRSKYKQSFINYLKTLVPNDADLLEIENSLSSSEGLKNLDEAFNLVIDHHKLKNENNGLAKYVNLFLSPEGFAEHIKRNFDWMRNLYLNREDYVKDIVNKSIMDLEYNDLLAELADQDIYLDLDEFADWIEDHNNKPSHFIQASNKRIIPEGSDLYNVYYEKFITLAEKFIQKPSGPALTADEKLKKAINEKELQKQKELEDAKIAFNTQLKDDTGFTEEELLAQKSENQTQNTEELKEAQARLDKFKALLEEIEAADVIVEDLEAIISKALDSEVTTEDEFNLFIENHFKDPKKVEEAKPFVEDLTSEGVANGLSQEDAVNQAFTITAYKIAFPELIKEKIKVTETEIEGLSTSQEDVIDIESTDAWKDYQAEVKKIEDKYAAVFQDLVDAFKKNGATPSTVTEAKAIPDRITVNTPWDNIPVDLQVILQKEFDKYASERYPDEDPSSLALIRQNWLPTQSVTIDAYNNAQIGTQKTEAELVAKIPKLKSVSDKLLDGRSLDQLSMKDLRAILELLEGKLKKAKPKSKDANNIKSDINALTKYITYVRATRRPTTKLEGVVKLLDDALLARQDEIDVLFTDGTTAGEAKSLEDLLSKTKKGYKFDNGKEPQRVTELVEEIEIAEKDKKPFVPKVAKDVAEYYDTIAFDTSIKEDKKLEEFLKGLEERIKNRAFKQLTLKKFEKIKAAVEKEFTREVVFDTVRDLAYSGASDSGTVIDGLIRDFFNDKPLVKPADMDPTAFEQLFGTKGILTLIKDDVIDGKFTVYANNLNVFDKELGDNGLAGEMDLLVVDNEGNISIIDVKTAKKATWDNFNTEDPEKFSKKYAYSLQQTIYRNLLFNMIGKKATIKLLPIELDYTIDGYIKTAKLANITDEGKSTIQLIPVDEVDKYVPLKDVKEIEDGITSDERSETQQIIESLKLDLESAQGEFGDPEFAAQLIQQIKDLEAGLNTEQETPTEDIEAQEKILKDKEERLANVKPVYHHTSVKAKDFNFDSFQRGKDQISQFGDGLNASSNTTSFLVKRYGKAIQGEVNDADFVVIDANKSEKELYDELIAKGYELNTPQHIDNKYYGKSAENEYDGTEPANVNPSVMSLFNDFQQSNPDVKGVKVINHILGTQKIAPFYVIYDPKSFYGPGALTAKIEKEINEELTTLGTPVDTSKTSIDDAKKIIKPTSGLGDLLIEVDEEGDIVVPQFDTLVKPLQKAKNSDDLNMAYADAMIAITQGNIPDVLENGEPSATKMNALVNALELVYQERQIAISYSSRKAASSKNLSKDDYILVKKPIFDSVKKDIFVVESVTDNKVKIKSLSTGKPYTATNDDLKNNFYKHNKMAYEIKDEVVITEEDTAAVVETKNNLDVVKKEIETLNTAKDNSKTMKKSDRFSKLKNNSNNC